MSRRAKKIEKRVSVDPKFNSELIAHVIRVIMKDGKKTTAERIVYGAVDKIKEAVEKDPSKFEKGEGDQKAVVTDTYPVPVEINPVRQLSLALRWMTTFAGARHGMGMTAAVAAEIIEAFQGQGNVIKKRDDVHKMAQANKAFAHYAW